MEARLNLFQALPDSVSHFAAIELRIILTLSLLKIFLFMSLISAIIEKNIEKDLFQLVSILTLVYELSSDISGC
jgi:hypothetical protein